jgi:hypothetical protein
MKWKTCLWPLTGLMMLVLVVTCTPSKPDENKENNLYYPDSKPLTRWWWFAAEIQKEDVAYQLDWLKKNHFGGVEIAFIYPENGDTSAPRLEYLGKDFAEIVDFTKAYADSLGLHCDFTFGTLWPFGGSFVENRDATKKFGDTSCQQWIRFSWEHPVKGRVLNHMDEKALERYSQKMLQGLGPAMDGLPSGWFCDSWEVHTRQMWTAGFDDVFIKQFGYDIKPYMDNIYLKENAQVHYDYMKLVSEYVIDEFYKPFTNIAHQNNAFSRVQCAGAPADLLSAYAAVDVPESEAILYLPEFSRIAASAATLTSKTEVTAETFTCIYGWKGWPGPGPYQKEEQVGDLKLLADALFAKGVNQIVWHGMPFNPPGDSNIFYASVHVGEDGALSEHLPGFNMYLQQMSQWMKSGKNYTDIAMYIPVEDSWVAGEYPEELQLPWAWGAYELRYIKPPAELNGYQPFWINGEFLEKATFENGRLTCGDAAFNALFVDVEYMDIGALERIVELAGEGLPIILKKQPQQPGKIELPEYQNLLTRIEAFENVVSEVDKKAIKPLIESGSDTEFWCRYLGEELILLFPHPISRGLEYPLEYGLHEKAIDSTEIITINAFGKSWKTGLQFKANQSIILSVNEYGPKLVSIDFYE